MLVSYVALRFALSPDKITLIYSDSTHSEVIEDGETCSFRPKALEGDKSRSVSG